MKPTSLNFTRTLLLTVFTIFCVEKSIAQQEQILPPAPAWKGKSLELVVKKDHPWITPVEKSDFTTTPSHAETFAWLEKIAEKSNNLRIISIGKSFNNREIKMVLASADKTFEATALRMSRKPLLLIQAGIHAGEIDGKDAGMMLLRDIAFGSKKDLLQNINIAFIPILNVDGHERISPYNRVNQRGPDNMGWRTNGRNLNLNRDYTKLDSDEVKAVVRVFNEYDPDLYLDLHVTDGADYQYDITYGYSGSYSPAITNWFRQSLSPIADNNLKANGHIPGPLMFAANDRDFTKGNIEYEFQARFSNTYGDLRHVPSILVENHSLKPFKQRVLGTYIFLEAVCQALAKDGSALQSAIEKDRALRNNEITISWKQTEKPDSMTLLGIESKIAKSQVTNKDYVVWTGKPVTEKIPYIKNTAPKKIIQRPKAYWVPATYRDVIERIRQHGINVETINTTKEVDVTMYRILNHQFSVQPFEGHFSVSGEPQVERRNEIFYPGSVRITTDQPLGDLLIHLLEPGSADSFLQWGFFMEIFSRTEYIEEYAIEPLARNMLAQDPKLKAEFEAKKQREPEFTNDSRAVYEWFYTRSAYVDDRYLLYPVGLEE